ncbi:Uma2 family endonuclease [Cohnella soli]|uniref:Uma2 family endonuclease n=1 Tax=Cohnella soli TaxID=425005 RepID=A0ABW0I4K3_9BACL
MARNKDDKEQVKEQQATYDTYAEMPDDGNRYEVLNGTLEMMSGPNLVHQVVSGKLHFTLTQSCNSEYLILVAPLDVILSRTNVLQPDLVLIHRSRSDIVTFRGIEGAPDLVVEIISPGSRNRDKVRKMKIYAQHQVPEYWVIDPVSRTLEQYLLSGEAYIIGRLFEGDETVISERLPCISYSIAELFSDPGIQKFMMLN